MLIRNIKDVKTQTVTNYNSTNTTIQWLINNEQGAPHFAMRLFTVGKGGKIGMHNHPEEHEIFILQGECHLIAKDGSKIRVKESDIIYIPPEEMHGYENIGNKELRFICVIPILKKN